MQMVGSFKKDITLTVNEGLRLTESLFFLHSFYKNSNACSKCFTEVVLGGSQFDVLMCNCEAGWVVGAAGGKRFKK